MGIGDLRGEAADLVFLIEDEPGGGVDFGRLGGIGTVDLPPEELRPAAVLPLNWIPLP